MFRGNIRRICTLCGFLDIEEAEVVNLDDTVWHDLLDRSTYVIPTSFIAELLAGEVNSNLIDSSKGDDFERGWRSAVKLKLEPAFIRSRIRYSGYDDMVERLGENLTKIVYCHDCQGDYSDLCIVSAVMSELEIPNHAALLALLSGTGLCMHVASLGVAIARANSVNAQIVGHPNYYGGDCRHHYGIKLRADDGRSQIIIPRGKMAHKIFKNRQFKVIPDTAV